MNGHKGIEDSLILVVEDNLTVQREMAFLLQVVGFNVMTAIDGAEALNIMVQHKPDVILSDVNMPGMDGFTLLRKVRTDKALCAVPFILTSSAYSYDDLMHALDLGANEFLPKPFDVYELVDAICLTLGEPMPIEIAR